MRDTAPSGAREEMPGPLESPGRGADGLSLCPSTITSIFMEGLFLAGALGLPLHPRVFCWLCCVLRLVLEREHMPWMQGLLLSVGSEGGVGWKSPVWVFLRASFG